MRRSILKRKYEFVSSIGHYCVTAMYLNRHRLRTVSSPLDWVGKGPDGFATHMELVCNGFSGLLSSPDAMILIPNKRIPKLDDCSHDYYQDSKTRLLIYHDFPADESLAQSFPVVRARYDRRIARFYDLIRQARRTLLVFQTYYERLDDAVICAKMEEVRRCLAPARVDLLVIEDEPKRASVEIIEPAEGIYHARGWFFKAEIDSVMGDIPLCDSVYAQVRLRKHFGLHWLQKRMLKSLVRLASMWHLTARRRRAAWFVLNRRYLGLGDRQP